MRISKQRLILEMAKACACDRDLCERSGVARPTLTHIKSGKRNPKPATIGKLARALGVPVEDLLLRPGEEPEVTDRPKNRKTDRLTLTAQEAAKELNVSVAQVYKLMEQPDFPSVSIGERRKVISTDGLREWIRREAVV